MKALAVLLALCACRSPDTAPRMGLQQPGPRSTTVRGLHVATKDPINSLDPTFAYDEISSYIGQPLFATLITYGTHSMELVPDLAERWELAPDGVTYVFHLRAGLEYQDGTPIVAGDFKYSLERALRTADSPFWPFLVDVVGATDVTDGKAADCAGIVAVSDRDLRIRLVRPTPAFLYILTMKFATPQREAYVLATGAELRREPLASGPFYVGHWDEGTALQLEANPRYWNHTTVYLPWIEMRENVPRDTQFLMFQRGELDTAEKLSPPDYLWIKGDHDWAEFLHEEALMQVFGSRMNTTVPPFNDVRVRRALNYALDKSHTIKLLNNAAVTSHGLLPPGMAGRDEKLDAYPHDVVKAKELLVEAGYPNGFDITYVTTNDDQAQTLAASLQSDLAEVGVRVKIKQETFAAFSTDIGNETGPAFSMGSWVGDYPDPTNFLDIKFHSRAIARTNAMNDTRYSNPGLDTLLDAARGELDPAKRAAMYRRAEQMIFDDAPWIFDYHPRTSEVTQGYVHGFDMHPIWLRDYTHVWLDLEDTEYSR